VREAGGRVGGGKGGADPLGPYLHHRISLEIYISRCSVCKTDRENTHSCVMRCACKQLSAIEITSNGISKNCNTHTHYNTSSTRCLEQETPYHWTYTDNTERHDTLRCTITWWQVETRSTNRSFIVSIIMFMFTYNTIQYNTNVVVQTR
jgi:hypothetical protein